MHGVLDIVLVKLVQTTSIHLQYANNAVLKKIWSNPYSTCMFYCAMCQVEDDDATKIN